MYGLTTPVGLVGGHDGVSALFCAGVSTLLCAGLQPLCLPNVSASLEWGDHGGLAPHLYLLMLAVAQEFIQKQEAINMAGQEVCELCWGCSKPSLRGIRM